MYKEANSEYKKEIATLMQKFADKKERYGTVKFELSYYFERLISVIFWAGFPT